MAHCQQLSSTEIAALFDEMSEDEEPVFESEDLSEADDATLTDEADTQRQLDLEFESVDGSERRSSPKAGRPIEHKEDPKKQKDNRRARERYKLNDGSYAPSGLYNRRVLSDSGNGSNRKELGKHATPLLVETWMKGAACKRLR